MMVSARSTTTFWNHNRHRASLEGTTAVGKSLETTGVFLLRPSGWNLKTLPGTSWASCRQRLQCLPSVVDRTLPSGQGTGGWCDGAWHARPFMNTAGCLCLPHLLRHFLWGKASLSCFLHAPCSHAKLTVYKAYKCRLPSIVPPLTHTHHSILQIPFLGRLERDMHENVGGLEHDFHFFHILEISSSQLTFIFFRGVAPTSYILHISRMNWWKSTGSDALFHQALQSSLAQLCRPGSATAMHCDALRCGVFEVTNITMESHHL